jgi:hypothetical protein
MLSSHINCPHCLLHLKWFFFTHTCPWRKRKLVCSLIVRRSIGTLRIRVQILVLAPFPEIYRRYALSARRRSRRQWGANGDFGNLQICRAPMVISGISNIWPLQGGLWATTVISGIYNMLSPFWEITRLQGGLWVDQTKLERCYIM